MFLEGHLLQGGGACSVTRMQLEWHLQYVCMYIHT